MSDTTPAVDLFIASIGVRDPESESGPTGPLRGALELRPARVVLVTLPKVAAQGEATQRRIAHELPDCHVAVEPLNARDPADLDSLLHACAQLLDRLLAPLPPDAAVALCSSSGTPQLGLALTLAASARAPRAQHYQALDPSQTERPWRPFDPDALRHHAELVAAFELLQGCRFAEAAELLERRAQSGSLEARARSRALRAALALAHVLNHANALQTDKAADVLLQAPDPAPDGQLLQPVRDWYAALKRHASRTNPAWPVELAARALRLQTAGRGPESLAAAATALEVAISVRLRTKHGLDPDALSAEQCLRLPANLRPEARRREGTNPAVYRLEGVQRRSDLLAGLEPPYAQLSSDPRHRELVERRNRLVHEAKAPSRDEVRSALGLLGDVCRAFGWEDPARGPTSPEAVAVLAATLRGACGLG